MPTPQPTASEWVHLGNQSFDRGSWNEAQTCFERALLLAPELEAAALMSARCAVKQGNWQVARERFAVLLRAHPECFAGWLEAGHVCQRHGTPEQVLASYRRAVAASPARWLGHATLAAALERHGSRDEAAAEYWRAQQCADSEKGLHAHRFMAHSRVDRGDAPAAVEAFAYALACSPADAQSQIDLGDALMRVGDEQSAHALFIQARRSSSSAVLTRLAQVLFRYNFWQEAEAVFRQLVQEQPADWAPRFNLARLLIESWRMQEGLALLEQAETLAGKAVHDAEPLRAAAAGKLADTEACLQQYVALGNRDGPHSGYRSSAAMTALYSDRLGATEAANLHRELFARLGEGARSVFPNEPFAGRKLRIGYVAADLHHQHPVNIFMQPVLARHDTRAFDVTVYFTGATTDAQTRQARARVSRWRDAAAWDDTLLAQQIAADGIDILVDLIGHTNQNRRVLFAKRAAPVQVSFLAYPASTGLPNMDWLIADAVTAPPGSESLYTEQLVRLPRSVFCYAPEEFYPLPHYTAKHAKRPFTFGSFNNAAKLTPATVALWSKVLLAVPRSRLLLKTPSFMDPAARDLFHQRFAAEGVDTSRIECRGPSPLVQMMGEYEGVDVALDTWPYNGGTTTCQALWMGVPVVTLAGEGFWQRMGASILDTIGHPEWVASTPEEFISIATQLAADRAALVAKKGVLRDEVQRAMEVDSYVRDVESIFRSCWAGWCSASRRR